MSIRGRCEVGRHGQDSKGLRNGYWRHWLGKDGAGGGEKETTRRAVALHRRSAGHPAGVFVPLVEGRDEPSRIGSRRGAALTGGTACRARVSG